jgi:hypothetical protein
MKHPSTYNGGIIGDNVIKTVSYVPINVRCLLILPGLVIHIDWHLHYNVNKTGVHLIRLREIITCTITLF